MKAKTIPVVQETLLRVRRYSGMASLPRSYLRLFEHGARESVFLSMPWFRNFEETIVGDDETVYIYGVDNGSDAPPLAALVLRSTHRQWYSPRRLEGLSNYYSCHFGPILDHDHGDIAKITRALATRLCADRPRWDLINLKPMDHMSPGFACLFRSLREVGMLVQTYFCFGNWYLPIRGRSYHDYFETLPRILQETIIRKGRKLDKQKSVRFAMITDADDLGQALASYERIYLKSWKNQEPYPQFIPGLMRTLAEIGWLRLGLMYVDGEPAAAQLWIVHNSVASIYKLAYDPSFAKLSVGTVLTARLMQHVIDVDKVNEVDYLSGDDGYKKDWMSHRRERWGMLACNPRSFKGLLQAVRHFGGRSIRRIWQKVVGTHAIAH